MDFTVEESEFKKVDIVHRQIPEFDEDHLEQKYFSRCPNSDPTLLLAKNKDGEGIGYIITYDKFEDGSYYVWMAGVKPECRRSGAMSEMIDKLFQIAKKENYECLKIKTRNERTAMRQLLEKYDFKIVDFYPVGDLDRHEILCKKNL